MAPKIPVEFKVGVLAVVAIVLLVLGYNMLRGKNIFSRNRVYYAFYDRVDGLAVAAHVRYLGMNVGRVQEMSLLPDGSNRIRVSLHVNPDLRIPRGSVARIVQIDLFGTKAVQIELANNADFLSSGDTLLPAYEGDVINEVKQRAASIFASLDSLVFVMNTTFDSQTRSQLKSSIASIEHSLSLLDKSLAGNTSRLDRIFANIESITNQLNDHRDELQQIMSNLQLVSDSLRHARIVQTLQQARLALEQTQLVLQKINQGSGSLGLLLNDDKLYRNLEASARDLDLLLQDLRNNPARYLQFSVFGKKQKDSKNR
ncbi:MAG: MlaD family protein [Chitinophagales bacterium]|nr:MlaD family protein [Chitinophagales bacterium]MDW8427434.1 MlaD family protein [Chitinophagales bacterium]